MRKRFLPSGTITIALLLAGAGIHRGMAETPAPTPRAGTGLVARVYAVADLVIPIDGSPGGQLKVRLASGPEKKPAQAATLENTLVQLVTNMVEPASWQANGGKGEIKYYPLGMGLFVRQTPAVHEQVSEVLDALRRLQDLEVVIETRILAVSESFFERLGSDWDLQLPSGKPTVWQPGKDAEPSRPNDGAVDPRRVTILNDKQLFQFLEAAQGDRRTNIMQAPKLTVFNGQDARIQVTDQQAVRVEPDRQAADGEPAPGVTYETVTTGLRMSLLPVVAADRRSVYLQVKINQTSPSSEAADRPTFLTMALDRSLRIPDGGTVVLGGWKTTREVRYEYAPPLLSRIPYLNRLFRSVGYGREAERHLVLVTPRVIIHSEELEKPRPAAVTDRVQAARSAAGEEEATSRTVPSAHSGQVARLIEKYHQACAAGRHDEAGRLARKALKINPTCFGKQPTKP